MQIRQVRYFRALCEEKSFTRAAKRCGVSQPSLTNGIRRLEEELGGELFYRSKLGAKLSPLGAAIGPHLRQIDRLAEKTKRSAATYLAVKVNPTHRDEGDAHAQDHLRCG